MRLKNAKHMKAISFLSVSAAIVGLSLVAPVQPVQAQRIDDCRLPKCAIAFSFGDLIPVVTEIAKPKPAQQPTATLSAVNIVSNGKIYAVTLQNGVGLTVVDGVTYNITMSNGILNIVVIQPVAPATTTLPNTGGQRPAVK
jgi:hypothetical protein